MIGYVLLKLTSILQSMTRRSVSMIKIHDDVIKWKHFRITGLCVGNSLVTSEVPSQRPVSRSFDFFYLRLNTIE